MELTGKNICYVADCGGIAFETCKVLMTKNIAKMAILHSVENPNAIAQLQSINPKTQIYFWKYNVTMESSDMKKYFDEVIIQMEYIDILINGATVCRESDITGTINVNLTGLINTTATVLPYMDRSKDGSGGLVVNIASVTGLDPSPVFCAYSAAKFGVIGFTRSLADPLYYEKTGVAVMAICPGPTKTFVRHSMTAFLEHGTEYVDKLKDAPCQPTAICGINIVKAIENGANGQIWIADMGRLELIQPRLYWKMDEQFVDYMTK
ncbi:alcohol dehydrogenase-related 31 kDa protein-like [Teleopsis dalmanni]|uniref:alcohol dehydrogenase-related 31 kDa protein-like n=1 Tax=Teleopsis dalmanni TaxID=139649 RepID=UPI0018CE0274|nr:alcohol dehydrogenase-related 31 kDa protein-like [Teleopsis dalmanni]